MGGTSHSQMDDHLLLHLRSKTAACATAVRQEIAVSLEGQDVVVEVASERRHVA